MVDFPLPTFDHSSCDGTGWCIAICPTDCITLWNDRPWLQTPGDCVSCGACIAVCPTNSVHFPSSAAAADLSTLAREATAIDRFV